MTTYLEQYSQFILTRCLSDGLERLLAVREGSDNLDIGFDAEQRGQGAAQHALIFRQHDTNPFGHTDSASLIDCGRRQPSAPAGNASIRFVPPFPPFASLTVPATASTLSRMPPRPSPSPRSPPMPFSPPA